MVERTLDDLSQEPEDDEPCYAISVAARMVRVHAQTLRNYERLGLVEPARSPGNIRLYSPREVLRLRRIKSLMEDLGVNLAGVEVVLRMSARMAELEREMERLRARLERTGAGSPRSAADGEEEN